MKSLTFVHRECKVFWGKFKEIKRGVPHQGSFQKLIFSPSPTSQDTLLYRTWNSLLMLRTPQGREDMIGNWRVILRTLFLRRIAQASVELNSSQQSLWFSASLIDVKDLILSPPSEKGKHTLCQATATNFLWDISSLQRKFRIHLSISFNKVLGQEWTEIERIIIPCTIDLVSCNLPAIDRRDAFQAESLDLILSAMGWKYKALGFPLKMGTPKYIKER